jgi:hypothetical protein
MKSKKQLVFNSSFIIPHSSFLPVRHKNHHEVVVARDVQLVADDVGELCARLRHLAFEFAEVAADGLDLAERDRR